MKKLPKSFLVISMIWIIILTGCSSDLGPAQTSNRKDNVSRIEDVPDYSGNPFVVVNDNQPYFSEEDYCTTSFEKYSDLDLLGRCGVAYANIGTDCMPTKKRGDIGEVKPTGWHTIKYDNVDGKYLYNRCHLIGYQLTAENANKKNLITGSRYLNVEGMLPFENMVADYIKETSNHVLYRVTPIFDGNNLVACGVQMEGYSVEDKGEGICYNVFVYNTQPGITINYATGDSSLQVEMCDSNTSLVAGKIRGNLKSKIYHCPGQNAYDKMEKSKNLVIFDTEQDAIDAGYRKAKQ